MKKKCFMIFENLGKHDIVLKFPKLKPVHVSTHQYKLALTPGFPRLVLRSLHAVNAINFLPRGLSIVYYYHQELLSIDVFTLAGLRVFYGCRLAFVTVLRSTHNELL